MDDSDSDSSVERLLNKNYAFLRNSCITKDAISTNSTTTSQAAPENGLESQVEQEKFTDTKPTDTVNESYSSRYDNLTLEELNNIAERIKIYHEVGVVVPEKIVSCQNKYKRKNSKKPQRMQQSIRKRKTTFGQGRIGTTCSTFGVKRCLCCNVDKENCSTVGEQNGCLIDGNNSNSLANRFPINELIQCQSNEVQELDRLTRTENEEPSTFQSCKRKRARKQSPIQPVTNSESTMSQLINLRGRTLQKTVEDPKSPLRGNNGDGLVTSTPLDIHSSRHRNRINPCNNSLDISAIEIGNTESDVECFVEDNQSTSEIIQNNGNYDVGNEEDIMEYVNDLLGTTADTIAEEVEERYQRLDESRRAVSDAISNAISSNHEVVHEEMDLEPSVILVSVGSPQPIIVVEDSIIQINEVDDTTHNVEETVTSIGVRTRRRGMASASCSNVKKTCGNVKVVESTGQAKKQQPSGSNAALRECSICLESLTKREISATTCGHVFCTECIKAAIRTCRMCPNCRTHLTLKKIHPLYL